MVDAYYIASMIILLMGVSEILFLILNYIYINKAKDEYNEERYEAVVLTNKSWQDKYPIYSSGVMFLLMHLKKNKKSYKLMKKFDRQKFNEFIYDANCYGLYIIGHGTRHSLKVGKGTKEEEVLEYSKFKDAPKKEFVVQLHCNRDGGESLADILASNKHLSFVPNGYRYVGENLLYFIRKYQPSLKMLIVLSPVIIDAAINICLSKIYTTFLEIFLYFHRSLLDIKRSWW